MTGLRAAAEFCTKVIFVTAFIDYRDTSHIAVMAIIVGEHLIAYTQNTGNIALIDYATGQEYRDAAAELPRAGNTGAFAIAWAVIRFRRLSLLRRLRLPRCHVLPRQIPDKLQNGRWFLRWLLGECRWRHIQAHFPYDIYWYYLSIICWITLASSVTKACAPC